jgi:hypothetical protein
MPTMTLRAIALAALISVGCYGPKFKDDIACDPSGNCPPGTTCGTDGKCHGPGTGTPIPDAPVSVLDASDRDGALPIDAAPAIDAPPPIDAKPVGCSMDMDCLTPPDLCSKAGTCNTSTHVCVFQQVDCSGLNDECAMGTCNLSNGQCIKAAINIGNVCGVGTVCGAFGACGGFDSVCDTTGTQTRSCTQHTCQAAACTPNTFNETQACTQTVGSCGAPTVTNCSACDYTSQCDQVAQQTCTCTTFDCSNGSCVPSATSCTQTCTRNTEGDTCAACVNFRKKECQNGICATTDC